jgi:predicted nucleic acid-binding Zn ribbon protein
MSKHNEYTIKDAINAMMKSYKLDDKLAENKLLASWDQVMGDMIAKHTKDIFIKNKQLFITLDSAALRNELVMAKTKIITMLNQHAGREIINDIVFK